MSGHRVFGSYQSTPVDILLTFNLKQPNNYRKYLDGSKPRSDAEAIYSDWSKVGYSLKQAAKRISN